MRVLSFLVLLLLSIELQACMCANQVSFARAYLQSENAYLVTVVGLDVVNDDSAMKIEKLNLRLKVLRILKGEARTELAGIGYYNVAYEERGNIVQGSTSCASTYSIGDQYIVTSIESIIVGQCSENAYRYSKQVARDLLKLVRGT